MAEGFKPQDTMSEARFGSLVSYLVRRGHRAEDVAAVLGGKSDGRTNDEVMRGFNSLVMSSPVKRKKFLGLF